MFPIQRPRRNRRTEALRRLCREVVLTTNDLVLPMFAVPGRGVRREIPSMPTICHLSVDEIIVEAGRAAELGIPAVLLFGIPEGKDPQGSEAWSASGAVQRAV